MYGFWVFEAERSFRHAASLDPDCAMAYWGAALANRGNEKRAKGFIAEAVKRKSGLTPREIRYIDALNTNLKADKKKKKKEASQAYIKALEDIVLDFPDDLEAKALLALELYRGRSSGVAISSYLAVDALMQSVFAKEPLHSAHHFRIHLWDHRRAQEALTSAAKCGQAAPAIAHMWHMPGHIYSRVKRYDDAVWQQEASARVDHNHMMRDRVLPDQIHNFAHNNEWLIRNLMKIGRVDDAIDLAKNMTSLPRHPKYNTLSKRGSAYYGRLRLFDVLYRYERWNDLIALASTPYLEPTDSETEQVKRQRYLGAAYLRSGQADKAAPLLAKLEEQLKTQKTAQDKAVAAAEAKVTGTVDKKKDEAAKKSEEKPAEKKDSEEKPSETVSEAEKKKLEAKKVAAEKALKKKIDTAKAAAKKPFSAKISRLEKAVNALKGHQAAADGKSQEAYDLLKKAGGEDSLYLARLRFEAGKKAEAEADLRKEVTSKKNEVLPLAAVVEVLWRQDKKDEAAKTFEQLRKISSAIDLEAAPMARLAPIARELKLPEDWRVTRATPKDVGDRPTLDSLGPFRWQPSQAPEWALQDAEGKSHTLKQYRGKPMVVIFYLGYGCLHCLEQLHAFGPKSKAFEEAGLSLVAIGSDDRESLNRALDNYEGKEFGIKLLSNAGLEVFKTYRAYDDFEKQPLHGTFIIDSAGLVRWQDISYEPFMDPDFVLKEAKRLLSAE